LHFDVELDADRFGTSHALGRSDDDVYDDPEDRRSPSTWARNRRPRVIRIVRAQSTAT
jgi:hypothetical protein